MTAIRLRPAAVVGLVAVAALQLLVRAVFPDAEKYYLHLLIQILLWAFIYTGRSLMGRFGLTSLGHGAFTGIGAYVTVMLWNFAASQDEDAAASVGIDVTREKLKITALSAALCALGGAVFAQYQMYIGPDTIAGLGLSLNMVFAVIAGGMWTPLGPTVGAVFTQVLAETLRVAIQGSATLRSLLGNSALALDQMVYGLLLVLFIIYMPKGILGTSTDWWRHWRGKARGSDPSPRRASRSQAPHARGGLTPYDPFSA